MIPDPALQAHFSLDSHPPFRLISRWTRLLGGAVGLSLETERKEGRANPEHGVRLELRIRW